jgi:hypothetical protein
LSDLTQDNKITDLNDYSFPEVEILVFQKSYRFLKFYKNERDRDMERKDPDIQSSAIKNKRASNVANNANNHCLDS